jgi:hypothetical protein
MIFTYGCDEIHKILLSIDTDVFRNHCLYAFIYDIFVCGISMCIHISACVCKDLKK